MSEVLADGGTQELAKQIFTKTKEKIDAAVEAAKTYTDNATPPIASATEVGVIKVGDGLSVTSDGTVSSNVSESYVDNKISELKIVMSHQYSFFESGTFIKPKGLTTFNVLAIGGKGGDCEGDGADTKSSCGGGGRGGTGDVVYKQLVFAEEEMSIPFTIGENGANGKTSKPASVYVEQTDYGTNGKDGSIGIAGKDGADGYTTTIIKTEKGQKGEDGKDLVFTRERESSTILSYPCTTSIAGMIKNAEGKINGKPTYARITIRRK